MLSIALTGNIAAGKSTVAGLFRQWGATVIDADELVREFAETARQFVTRHHEYLESTGLGDYAALPHKGPGPYTVKWSTGGGRVGRILGFHRRATA
jgi:hypothetical protein